MATETMNLNSSPIRSRSTWSKGFLNLGNRRGSSSKKNGEKSIIPELQWSGFQQELTELRKMEIFQDICTLHSSYTGKLMPEEKLQASSVSPDIFFKRDSKNEISCLTLTYPMPTISPLLQRHT
ncbi:hypothetical protein AVEN_235343-1 [Araneus ventricosus]|uniref:Uncharacterized protein n=1 Tax=Araneus ventricosus TaxID=182803 RepID=A0A4Y2A4S8_ARAVE|nr:hypothetical protein AVEN_235343-1 [Araneus ventricosus]